MIRKVLLAVAATVAVGAATLVTFDDASAARGGGVSRGGGMSRSGGFNRGGATMRRTSIGRPSGISRRPNIHRPGLTRRPGVHRPGHRRPQVAHHRRHGSFGGHQHRRHGSFGGRHHRFGSHGRFHRRGWSWGGGTYVTYGGAPVVYGAPAAAPVQATPASAPVCDSCGGWTQDGCYMTYRKVVDENGNPQLKCVKACDEVEQQTQAQ
jgi:hypothetical protein